MPNTGFCAGWRYVLNSAECIATASSDGITQWNQMGILYTDHQRWKAGAQLTCNCHDFFTMHLTGDYYFYREIRHNTTHASVANLGSEFCVPGRIYDKPLWEISARLDGHIDNHWSLYTDNRFQGRRWALTTLGDRQLPAFIDINLGVGYRFANTPNAALNRLYLYAELQNILNRRNCVWYGYESYGIHGRLGLSYRL